MPFARLRYELRALGIVNLLLPLVVIGCFAVVAIIGSVAVGHNGGSDAQSRFASARILLFFFEAIMPLVIGFATATNVMSDPAKELHMSLPHAYAQTIEQRLAIYLLWTACLTLSICIAITSVGYWIVPQGHPQDQLTWLVPLLWNSAAGALIALLVGSSTAAVTVLAFLTLGQTFLNSFFLEHDALHPFFLLLTNFTIAAGPGATPPLVPDWLTNRLTLLAMALAMLTITSLLLRRNEALLSEDN